MWNHKFKTFPEAREILSGLSIGYIEFKGAYVKLKSNQAKQLLDSAVEGAKEKFPSVEAVKDDPEVKSVRELFRKVGLDPNKEVPSGEALIKRAVSGENVPFVNNVVAINNYLSIKSGYPCGVYDSDNINGMIRFYIGKEGGQYIALGGRMKKTDNQLLLRDDISIFGGATADSQRTAISKLTKNILMIIYHPKGATESIFEEIMEEAKEKMSMIADCEVGESGVYDCGETVRI
jgi:DNA/RNA-binding domain of Phe-tRNA-synthetase-like protein